LRKKEEQGNGYRFLAPRYPLSGRDASIAINAQNASYVRLKFAEVLSKDVLCILKGFFRKLLKGNWGIWGKKFEHPRTMFDLVLSVKIGIVGGV
jgi:hypothetical protein